MHQIIIISRKPGNIVLHPHVVVVRKGQAQDVAGWGLVASEAAGMAYGMGWKAMLKTKTRLERRAVSLGTM